LAPLGTCEEKNPHHYIYHRILVNVLSLPIFRPESTSVIWLHLKGSLKRITSLLFVPKSSTSSKISIIITNKDLFHFSPECLNALQQCWGWFCWHFWNLQVYTWVDNQGIHRWLIPEEEASKPSWADAGLWKFCHEEKWDVHWVL